jgi:hypothetical protein
MILLKVKSDVLSTALKNAEIRVLHLYLSSFERTEDGCFICREINGIPTIRPYLEDYTFNERESETLWKIAKQVVGKETIDLQTISRAVI